nr:NADP-specific glutamate dehydrogenase [Tanacetum cinerariifolium]
DKVKVSEGVRFEVYLKRRKRRRCFEGLLEEIPEQMSEGDEVEEECCCCCDCGGGGGDAVVEADVEGVRWAVDVGIWVMCLGVGVGYLVSKASSKSLRRRRLF